MTKVKVTKEMLELLNTEILLELVKDPDAFVTGDIWTMITLENGSTFDVNVTSEETSEGVYDTPHACIYRTRTNDAGWKETCFDEFSRRIPLKFI